MRARPAAPPRRPRPPWPGWVKPTLWTAGLLVGALAVLSVIAVLHALRIESRINGLPTQIQAAESDAENGQLARALKELRGAQQTLTSANSALYGSFDFDVVHLLPVARQNLDAIRSAVTLGLQMVAGGEQILQAAAPLESPDGHLEVPLKGGQVPLATTGAVQSAVTQVITDLPADPDPPSNGLVIGRVRTAVRRVYAEAARRRAQLENVDQALQLMNDMAGANGDRRYLIAVANSAEMRGAGGMILSYGVLYGHAGKISLVHFGPISEIQLSQPETKVTFPADFMNDYSDLAPTTDWRDATMMSDFRVDGPVLEAMFEQRTGSPVDGVIQVDSAGLGAILSGIGPVQTPDLGVVSAANVVPLTLSQAYQLFPARQVRQDYTEEAARATFAKLTSGSFPGLRALGRALVQARRQRHIVMFASDPTDEDLIKALGFDGSLPPKRSAFAQLTVQNFGQNKLDYYLASSLSISGQKLSPLGSHVKATIYLHNGAPPGQTSPVEVFGPFAPGDVVGQYLGLVTLYLPEGSYLQGFQADGSVTGDPFQSSQNGVPTVTYTVAIPAGGSSAVVLDLYIPPMPSGTVAFTFVPTPRVIPTHYRQSLK